MASWVAFLQNSSLGRNKCFLLSNVNMNILGIKLIKVSIIPTKNNQIYAYNYAKHWYIYQLWSPDINP